MLTEICADLRNYFCRSEDIHSGKFEISGGSIAPLDFLKDGQYFRIVGSTFNDGVHRNPAFDLTDEIFEGSIWAMSVPEAVVKLSEEIKQYQSVCSASASAYISESFGGYSYTKATKNGAPLTWREAFASRLNLYRRMREF